jgi:D-alanyl-D-alanine carboxypeptidase
MRAGLFLTAMAVVLMLPLHAALAGPALLFDPADGRVLYAEDIDDQWHPASLTKMMTAYLAFEAIEHGKLRLDQNILCSASAFAQPPSKVGLAVGNGLTVETALQALIVKSANDVAVMLAEAVDGSEAAFVIRMNATAKRLGMTRTNFVNANGLPADAQVTTARDFAKLARAIVHDYPGYAAYWAMPSVHLGKFHLRTHNGLLKSFEGADGMKTGFICDSGYNIVASATRDGRKLMAVVLGEQSGSARTLRASSLLEYGYQQYGWKSFFNQETIENRPISPGAKGVISVRNQVTSWDCGRPARIAARKAKAEARAAAAKAKKNAKEAAAKAPPAGAAVGAKPAAATPAATGPIVSREGETAKPAAASATSTAPPKAATKTVKSPAPAAPAAGNQKPASKTVGAAPATAAAKPAAASMSLSGATLPDNMKPKTPADGLLKPTIKVSPAEAEAAQ